MSDEHMKRDQPNPGQSLNPPSPRQAPPNGNNEDESIEQVPLYRKKRVMIPLVLAVLLGAGALWSWYVNYRNYDSTDDAYIDADRVSISTKILGRITELAADEGDTVHSQQVIVRLDDTDLKAQEIQARAALVSAEQNVTLAKVNLAKAADDLNRAAAQYKEKVIPQEQYDHAQRAKEAAQAQHAIALAQVGSAQAQLGVIQTNLQNTRIASPMDGVIAKRWVLTGDVVQPAQPIYTIYDLSHIWITANFEETKLSSIKLNDPVEISVDAYPDHPFRGKVIQIGSNTASQFSLIPPNNASGNFTKITQRVPIKISLEDTTRGDTPRQFLPGMSVEVKVKVR